MTKRDPQVASLPLTLGGLLVGVGAGIWLGNQFGFSRDDRYVVGFIGGCIGVYLPLYLQHWLRRR